MNTEPLLKTYAVPYKYGKAIIEGSGVEGAFDSVCVGMPFMFRHNGKNFMLYTGFDGIGYQSALAVSDDLLHWQHYGMVLERTGIKGKWDSIQTCGTWILRDEELYGTYKPKKFQGKYWMIYHSYPEAGVEEGPGVMGMAWTEDENLLDWHRLDEPIFSWRDGADWEKGGLYKASLVQKDDTFYAFYNAKNQTTGLWIEQTGVVTSKDLVHWERYKENPVIRVKPDSWRSKFVSDPCLVRDRDLWLMYFFGYDYKHAQDGIAVSKDLLHWEIAERPILCHGSEGEIDSIHAHKAAIITVEKRIYHFYCTARPWKSGDKTKAGDNYLAIGVASSEPF